MGDGEARALYVPDGDRFVGTVCTGSAWDGSTQSGGAVLALLGHVLEDVPTLVPMSLTRLTVDIVRPVPVGQPLAVTTEVLREGKKIQVVELEISAGDVTTTRARALRIRDRDVSAAAGMPTSTSSVNPIDTLPGPDEIPGVELRPGVAEFLRLGAELRRTPEPVGGQHLAWCRLRVPVVAGEPVRPTSRATLPLDLANMLGVHDLDPRNATSINPDVTGHVNRVPEGEWVALTGNTYYDHGVGHGVSIAVMSDVRGVFGTASTSQLLDQR
ncbi:MAG TPA: thioesterase family protein [Acidimicrobiales bacterium]|nr:thioesterase family protein [Acidimicrobiales bacterium]